MPTSLEAKRFLTKMLHPRKLDTQVHYVDFNRNVGMVRSPGIWVFHRLFPQIPSEELWSTQSAQCVFARRIAC